MQVSREAVGLAFAALIGIGLAIVGYYSRAGRAEESPVPAKPEAETLEKWLEGKDVVEVWFAGPHVEPLKLKDSLQTQGVNTASDETFRFTPGDYAGAWVAFYLRRIEEHKGEYFSNVAKLLRAPNAVPALIATLDSKDKNLAKRAEAILGEIHHSVGTKEKPPALPKSKPEWLEWWKSEGVKLSSKELWHNFDSHYQ